MRLPAVRSVFYFSIMKASKCITDFKLHLHFNWQQKPLLKHYTYTGWTYCLDVDIIPNPFDVVVRSVIAEEFWIRNSLGTYGWREAI